MRIKRIDSAANSIYKDLLTLTTAKGIGKLKKCLISGEKIVRELVDEVPEESFFVFHGEHHDLFDLAPEKQCVVLKKDLFKELDVVGTNAPLLCSPTLAFHNWESEGLAGDHELLCAVGDPNNLGAILRSACAFGVRKAVLLSECANPFLPKVTKAASGCNFLMTFEKGPSIHDLGDVSGLVALDMNGRDIREFDTAKPSRWLIGEEGLGVPSTLRIDKVAIPMKNDVESLNAAVSASILLYEIFSSRG